MNSVDLESIKSYMKFASDNEYIYKLIATIITTTTIIIIIITMNIFVNIYIYIYI